MFFNIGGGEILVIAMVALIAVGPEQLPSLLRKIGRFVSQARSVTSNLRDEFMSGLDEVNELADPEKWMGSGSDDDPVVPRGYAEQKQRPATNPNQRRSSDPAISSDPPASNGGSDGAADSDSVNGAEGADGEPKRVVNQIAAANAMRADDAPSPVPTADEPDAGDSQPNDSQPNDSQSKDSQSEDSVSDEATADDAAAPTAADPTATPGSVADGAEDRL